MTDTKSTGIDPIHRSRVLAQIYALILSGPIQENERLSLLVR